MSMVPEAGLTKKVSPVGLKKKNVKKRNQRKNLSRGGGNEENSWVKKEMSAFTQHNEHLLQPRKGKEW